MQHVMEIYGTARDWFTFRPIGRRRTVDPIGSMYSPAHTNAQPSNGICGSSPKMGKVGVA